MIPFLLTLGLAQGLLCTALPLQPLRFNDDGAFKIALFTDLHYGESSELDLKSDEAQRMVLEQEKPDFIVFGGDMVSGWHAKGKDGWFQNRWHQLTAPAREFSIPYALVLGNHDDEGNLDRRQILQHDIDTSDGLSYTKQGPYRVGGASNYYIDIFPNPNADTAPVEAPSGTDITNLLHPSKETKNVSSFSANNVPVPLFSQNLAPTEPEPAARLWFFDSMNRGCLIQRNSWGCIAPTAIQWASTISKTIPLVPTAMAFAHIPIPEVVNVWEQSTEPVYGRKREFSNCQGINTGLHKFAKENGVQAVWSGHDHVNDFVGVWEGVRIGYGRKSGYGSYFYGETVDPVDSKKSFTDQRSSAVVPVQRGARIIELRQGESANNAKNWIALESGVREYQRVIDKWLFSGPSEQTVCRSGAVAVSTGVFCNIMLAILAFYVIN
ncbi:putative inactive purple acid phosphatase 28 [Nannochloris sp. 'desiccata']|nr:putative inactive purple acid phosphatase 28 [Chlorella desiccata (nom. nud.)]